MKKIFYLLAIVLSFHSFGLNGQTNCPNLVTNGDFEVPNASFTYGLPFNAGCAFNTYSITTKFNLKCPALPNFGDHTSGLGKFLVVQGSTSTVNIWSTTVTVTPNTPYTFSFWVSGATATSASERLNPATLVMSVDGTDVPLSIVTLNNPGWVKYTYSGTPTLGHTSLPIAIKQISTGQADYGIDDIVFTSCVSAEPCLSCPTGMTAGANLIVNGDFSLGNTNFTNNYTYFTAGTATGIGKYSVLNSTQVAAANSQWACIGNTSTDAFLACDGASSTGQVAWRGQTINTTIGAQYRFCFSANNLVIPTKDYTDPILEVWINGIKMAGPVVLPETPDVWVPISTIWSATSASAVIEIRTTVADAVGNDFAIDNINFNLCSATPDPCYPSFTTTNLNNCGNVQFNNQSDGTLPLTYSWNFGDNSGTSTAQNPIHQYNSCGTYNACLTLLAADGCTANYCLQVIVADNVAPIITCPPTVTVSCSADTIPSVTGLATATDNCGTPTLSYRNTQSGVFPCDGTLRRTWTATDKCGNTSSCFQIVIVSDKTLPTITCPQNTTVSCSTVATPALTGTASATDNCGTAPTITSVDQNLGFLLPCSGTINRTWTARDACGNTSTCLQVITVSDRIPPTIVCPPNITVACATDTLTSVTGLATATDNCIGAFLSRIDTVSGTLPCDAVVRRTWRARDNCGNVSSCVQTIFVRDNVAPTITCPANITVNCLSNIPPSVTGSATVTDNCSGSATTSYTDTNIGVVPCDFYVRRTWTARDACGNTSTCQQAITPALNPPIITCPANITVQCGSTDPSVTGTATAIFDCGTAPITYTDVTTGTAPCTAIIQRTWRAAGCRSATCVQTITVKDATAPTIVCPQNTTVNTNTDLCDYQGVIPQPIVSDNCDLSLTPVCSIVTTSGLLPITASTHFPKGVHTIGCIVQDDCGNSSPSCTFKLTVVDNQPPKIICPLSVSVAGSITPPSTVCKAIVNGLVPTVTDNCPMTTVGFNITPTANATPSSGTNDASGGSFSGTSTVVYTATDMAGNTASCSFNVAVTCSPCLASFNYTTSGSCNNIQFTNQSSGAAPITYSWTFGDNTTSTSATPIHQFPSCGTFNVCLKITTGDGCRDSVCRQITIDNVVPTMTCPANMTVACVKDTTPSVTGRPVVTDNCSTPILTYVDVISGSLPCDGSIRRTWTATDACGNKTTCTQTIVVFDNVKPVITNCPTNQTVNTNAGQCYYTFPTLPVITATDNCGATPSVSYTYINSLGITLPFTTTTQFPKGTNFLTITVRDACNNVSTCSFTLTVVDIEKPKITCPQNVSVVGTITPPSTLCKAVVNGLAPTVTDNCPMTTVGYSISGATTASGGSDASGTTFMQGVSTVTYIVTDMAGNKDSCKFTVTVTCGSSQPDFKGFDCGQAILSCFSGFKSGTTNADPDGPVLAQIDVRQHGLANLGTNWYTSPPVMYHAPDWKSSKMGQIFGVTIDPSKNVYAAATTIYGKYLPSPLTNAAFGNVYKIDATTGNVSVLATLPQDLINPAGLGDVWYDDAHSQLLVSNFSDGKIYRMTTSGAPIGVPYIFPGVTGSPFFPTLTEPGFAPLGQRVWAVATNGNKLYFSVWNEDKGSKLVGMVSVPRNSAIVHNQIYSVALDILGQPTGLPMLEHDMSNLVTIDNSTGVSTTQDYSSPVSDIQFSQTGNMLVAERSMNNDFGNAYVNPGRQAHNSRVIELSAASSWSERIIYVGNPYNLTANPTITAHHANSSGGIDYGYESFNPKVTALPSKCDSMIWSTGDALRFPGYNSISDGSPLPGGGGTSDYVYGLAGMRWTGNSNDPSSPKFVKKTSIYIDVDNNLSFGEKTQIGDVDIFKCGCVGQASVCDSISITSMPSDGPKDTCCFKLTINNQKPSYFTGIQLCASSGVSISDVSVLSGFNLNSYDATQATVVAAGGGTIPVGVKDMIKFCLSNYQNVSTQQVIVKYYGPNFEVVCMDTLTFHCDQKPKCLKVTGEAICGQNGTYQMTFCVMSSPLIAWNVASFELNAPPGVTFTPSVFTGLNIPPNGMQCNFTTTVSGDSLVDGQNLCFSVTGHAANITTPINCCTDTVVKACVQLPSCICSKVSADTMSVASVGDTCCWKIVLTNNYSTTYFSGVEVEIKTLGVSFGSITNPLGSGWQLLPQSATDVIFNKINPGGTTIGSTAILPKFCLSGIVSASQIPQIVVVKWLGPNGQVVCTDTLKLNCGLPIETDCAVIVNPKIECDLNSPSGYTFSFQIYNNSSPSFTANQVMFSNVTGGTLTQTSFPISPLAYHGTSSVLTTSIFGALPGSTVFFDLSLHEIGANNNDLNCCSHSKRYYFTMPQCPDSCNCGPFNILYAISRGPLLPKNCGDTLFVPASPNLPIAFIPSFQCTGTNCPAATVDWILTGPTGFTTLSAIGVAATPGFAIPITNATFTIGGMYTLTMTGHCGSHLCVCTIKFNAESKPNCCQDVNVFRQNVNNNVTVTANNALCKATVNIGSLPSCDEITNIQWGDGTNSGGPFGAGTMPMHNYTGSGTYYISFLAIERNPLTGLICFEYQKRDSVKLICNSDTCRCGEFSSIFYRPSQGGATVAKVCGDTLPVFCTPQFSPILSGVYNCIGTCPTSGMKWELRKTPTSPVLQSGTIGTTFSLPLLASYFATSGKYELTLIPQCGSTNCASCKFTLDVQLCDTCQCRGFENMSIFNNSWKPLAQVVKCDSTYNLPCTQSGSLFYFHGNFLCSSTACLSDSISWSIGQGSLKIAGGKVKLNMMGTLVSSHFDIPLQSSWFTPGVQYTMTVTGTCGNQVCTCKINFTFAACPCPCPTLIQEVNKGFKVTGATVIGCKRTFMPIGLCATDQVEWTFSGISTVGTSTGNGTFTMTFPTSGFYSVCMRVRRFNPDGTLCGTAAYCQVVKVVCFPILPNDPSFKLTHCEKNSTSGNVIKNGNFTEGVIAGHLGYNGVAQNWTQFPYGGDGYTVVDATSGASDDGHLMLNGDRNNPAGVFQQISLPISTYTVLEYYARNYLGNSLPRGTVLEFRLYNEPIVGSASQLIYSDTIPTDSSAWMRRVFSPRVNPDQTKRFLSISLMNNSLTDKSAVGIDNFEICSSATVNTKDVDALSSFKIVPNPNQGTFTVVLSEPASLGMKLRILDPTGKYVQDFTTQINNDEQTIQANHLPSGLYFLQVISDGKIIGVEKFVKQ